MRKGSFKGGKICVMAHLCGVTLVCHDTLFIKWANPLFAFDDITVTSLAGVQQWSAVFPGRI